jgi:hypothetical protein
MKRLSLQAILAMAMISGAFAGQAVAAEQGGTLKKVAGDVRIERGSDRIQASVGTAVMPLDRIVTGAEASAGITLRDDTLLSVGPNTTLVLEQFAFNTTTHDGNLALRILRGTFFAVSGLIARRNPGAFAVSTPVATIGIRGTEFIVEVPGND